ncbi:MAG: hypothetical protein ABIR05_02555 [Luteimonas sp.]
MNRIDDHFLHAYVDGELDSADTARVEAAMVLDGALARRVRQACVLRAELQATFDPVLGEPVPERVAAMLHTQSVQPTASGVATAVTRISHGRGFGAGRRRATRRWLAPTTLAASLAVLAVVLWSGAGDELVRVRDGQQFAAGALSDALDQALASEPDPDAAVAIGLTFRSTDGRVCRTFVHRRDPGMAGMACHDASGWALPVTSAIAASESGELRQAASGLPSTVQDAVDARVQGDVFDGRQERAAREAGWR